MKRKFKIGQPVKVKRWKSGSSLYYRGKIGYITYISEEYEWCNLDIEKKPKKTGLWINKELIPIDLDCNSRIILKQKEKK